MWSHQGGGRRGALAIGKQPHHNPGRWLCYKLPPPGSEPHTKKLSDELCWDMPFLEWNEMLKLSLGRCGSEICSTYDLDPESENCGGGTSGLFISPESSWPLPRVSLAAFSSPCKLLGSLFQDSLRPSNCFWSFFRLAEWGFDQILSVSWCEKRAAFDPALNNA